MRRRAALAAGICAATAALALPAGASALTKVVYPGGPGPFATFLGKHFGAGVDNFLINRVVIHTGDSVVWSGKGLADGFHSVDIPAKGGSDVPLIIPTGKIISGVNDFAGNPFWFNGLSFLEFNPLLFGPSGGHVYNGSARVESGLPLRGPHDFKVRFTKPGVYEYFCDVHHGMHGFVVVKRSGAIPSAAADAITLKRNERHYIREAKRVDRTRVHGAKVSLGASGRGGLEVFAMFPSKLTVKAGTVVTFFMSRRTRETHTATFAGTKAYLRELVTGFNSSPIDPRASYPSSPFASGPIPLSPTSHGNGFASVGALDRDSDSSIPASGKIDFTTPGTYHFICLIHPFMHGTVVVK